MSKNRKIKKKTSTLMQIIKFDKAMNSKEFQPVAFLLATGIYMIL